MLTSQRLFPSTLALCPCSSRCPPPKLVDVGTDTFASRALVVSSHFHDYAAAVVVAVVVIVVVAAAAAVVGGGGSEDDYDDNCTENLHTRKLDIHHEYRLLSTSAAECHPVALIVTTSCWHCCCCCWRHVSDDH